MQTWGRKAIYPNEDPQGTSLPGPLPSTGTSPPPASPVGHRCMDMVPLRLIHGSLEEGGKREGLAGFQRNPLLTWPLTSRPAVCHLPLRAPDVFCPSLSGVGAALGALPDPEVCDPSSRVLGNAACQEGIKAELAWVGEGSQMAWPHCTTVSSSQDGPVEPPSCTSSWAPVQGVGLSLLPTAPREQGQTWRPPSFPLAVEEVRGWPAEAQAVKTKD